MTAVDPLAVADELIALTREIRTEPKTDAQLTALALAVTANLPVLLWGEPGTGKTAALNQLAGGLDVPLETVIASVHEPSDFAGLPVIGADPGRDGVPMAPPDWAVRLAGYGWSRVTGAAEEMTTIFIMQRAHAGDQRLPMWNDFWTAVYQTIDD